MLEHTKLTVNNRFWMHSGGLLLNWIDERLPDYAYYRLDFCKDRKTGNIIRHRPVNIIFYDIDEIVLYFSLDIQGFKLTY